MRLLLRTVRLVLLGTLCAPSVARAQTMISGSSLAMKSTGSGSGTHTLDRNGYVGTYINVASAGNVTVRVNASGTPSGGIDPHMNIVLADTKAGFNVPAGLNPYEYTFRNMPAGTYFLRTEFNNDQAVTPRALAIQDVTVTGATVANSSTSANALAAADSYIQNFRKGAVKVGLSGLAPGTSVTVSLKRHAFNFGTAVPGGFSGSGTDSGNYLGSNGTTKQTNYQSRLNLNFNAIVPENMGKWAYNESTRDSVTMGALDQLLNYAQSPAHPMRVRMHNLIWGDNSNNGQQPSWVLNNTPNGLLDLAPTNATAAADLRAEISERIDSYVGTGTASDRARKYVEIDIYNESYHTGADPNIPDGVSLNEPDYRRNYWRVYDANGIADIYREVRDSIAISSPSTKLFVNEYGALGGGDYATWYMDHIEKIRQAGVDQNFGEVLGGIGVQDYTGGSQNAGNVMRTLQNLSVQGLPLSLTEFGVNTGVSAATAANILGETMRLSFGTPDMTGFFTWGFHQESGTGATTMFAPSAALYTVNTSDFNTWTITPAGQKWQELLGIQDSDGNPNNGWTTQLSALVGPDGTISFDGFWGDYELKVGATTIGSLTLNKGTSLYSVVVSPGDFNGDRVVDAADYVLWRRTEGSATDLRADGNGNGFIDSGDYDVWRSHFGATYASGTGLSAVPEPSTWILLSMFSLAGPVRRRRLRNKINR